mgnify:CR=1 FL=1
MAKFDERKEKYGVITKEAPTQVKEQTGGNYMNEMNNVLAMCEKDPAMNELLDQLFVLYNLKKVES